MTLLAILSVGFFLGMRHATDADHVVAVTTIVARERNIKAALWIGALWGIGHTATIMLVGGAIVVLGVVIPPRLGLSMEMSVAVMLIGLGAMNLSGAMKRIDEAAHNRPITIMRGGLARPLLVGVVHGLAGSAAVALLVLATIRDAVTAIVYLGTFGLGTVVGMMLLTSAMAAPIAVASKRFQSAEPQIARVSGLVSVVFGLFLVYQIGIVDGLLSASPTWSPH